MSQKEKVQEVLEALRACALLFITALFGVLSYVFLNYKALNRVQGSICCVTVIFIVIFIVLILKSYIKHLNKLEKM